MRLGTWTIVKNEFIVRRFVEEGGETVDVENVAAYARGHWAEFYFGTHKVAIQVKDGGLNIGIFSEGEHPLLKHEEMSSGAWLLRLVDKELL